jgi:hypothetical protein
MDEEASANALIEDAQKRRFAAEMNRRRIR